MTWNHSPDYYTANTSLHDVFLTMWFIWITSYSKPINRSYQLELSLIEKNSIFVVFKGLNIFSKTHKHVQMKALIMFSFASMSDSACSSLSNFGKGVMTPLQSSANCVWYFGRRRFEAFRMPAAICRPYGRRACTPNRLRQINTSNFETAIRSAAPDHGKPCSFSIKHYGTKRESGW